MWFRTLNLAVEIVNRPLSVVGLTETPQIANRAIRSIEISQPVRVLAATGGLESTLLNTRINTFGTAGNSSFAVSRTVVSI